MARKPDTKEKLKQLRSALKGGSRLLIVLQDRPDPDAMAAAVAMRQLVRSVRNVRSVIACGGAVARAENRAS